MEKEMEFIKEQSLFNNYAKELRQIVNNPINRGSCFAIAIDSFALGIIVGKKLERVKLKKLKIDNNKVLKRQEELLLVIEILELKNDKLESLILENGGVIHD